MCRWAASRRSRSCLNTLGRSRRTTFTTEDPFEVISAHTHYSTTLLTAPFTPSVTHCQCRSPRVHPFLTLTFRLLPVGYVSCRSSGLEWHLHRWAWAAVARGAFCVTTAGVIAAWYVTE